MASPLDTHQTASARAAAYSLRLNERGEAQPEREPVGCSAGD